MFAAKRVVSHQSPVESQMQVVQVITRCADDFELRDWDAVGYKKSAAFCEGKRRRHYRSPIRKKTMGHNHLEKRLLPFGGKFPCCHRQPEGVMAAMAATYKH